MKRISKSKSWPVPALPTSSPTNDMSYDDMLLRAKEIMSREINHLMLASAGSKLNPDEAKDLIQLVKVLQTLTKQEAEQAEALSEEELKNALEEKNK